MMPFHTCRDITNKDAAYDLFKQMFLTVVDKHAPLKKKPIRRTQAPFMNKELSKAIMHRSKLRNIYNKTKTTQAWEAFKRQRYKCVSIRRKNIRSHFSEVTEKSGTNSAAFWTALKPFLSSKHLPKSHKIILNENRKITDDSISVTNIMNDYFINIVEKTTGKIPRSLPCSDTDQITDSTINEIIKRYENHPSIVNIKVNTSCTESKFQFKEATRNDVISIIKTLKRSASIGIDEITLKLVIIVSEIISDPLSELINETLIKKSYFPTVEKVACVTPAFKKEDRFLKENYRPISVLNVFSKISERFLSD